MAFNPGRNVGRLSIRVVPDTKQFRRELKRSLDVIEKTTSAKIRIDGANLDKVKIREDIRRQMQDLRGVNANVNVRVEVDRARLKKAALRKSIQDQFDKFDNIRVNIEAAIKNVEHFEKEVRDMVQRASRNKVKIDVAALTAAATTQLRWLSRDRFVNLIVRVSQASVVKALTTLAALSGARLTWKWIDNLIDKFKELDRNLPAILGWTTGITSGIAALFAATSGLVGVGQGLFAITPALLVIPGLALNAIGSLTALIVALKNANSELSPLKDDMSELGDIINAGFWGTATAPIIDLVSGLMPQLRVAFHDLSTGIGEFTAAMSQAFGKELANGRLASIFNGIAEGWRVLGTGAEGFAGALVSLSQIAATYTPRLAGWFVRQANTFDKWLKAISEDGRLGRWMEDAIDAMYDVWDVTRGLAGVFTGLWKAADQAGSGGLHGFGQLMLEWRRTVHSADFQRGLTAIFRGSYEAMDAFGDAVVAIGRLISDNSRAFETFIASAGTFLGGLIAGIADALNTPLAAEGLDDLSSGLIDALNGILPHLPAMADTFGNFLGLLGDLAGTLLPTAAGVLADLMPSIDSLVSAIRPVLPDLTDAVAEISSALAPAIKEFVDVAGPVFVDAIVSLAEALVDLAPAIADLVAILADLIEALGGWAKENKEWFDGVSDWMSGRTAEEGAALRVQLDALKDLGVSENWVVNARIVPNWDPNDVEASAKRIATQFMTNYKSTLITEGQGAADALLADFRSIEGLPPEVVEQIEASLKQGFRIPSLSGQAKKEITAIIDEIESAFKAGGKDSASNAWKNLVMGGNGKPVMTPELRQYVLDGLRELGVVLDEGATDVGSTFADRLTESLTTPRGGRGPGGGGSFTRGIAKGITDGTPDVTTAADSLWSAIKGVFGATDVVGSNAGTQVSTGVAAGITMGAPHVTMAAVGIVTNLQAVFSTAGTWLVAPGRLTMAGYGAGIAVGGVQAVLAAAKVRSAIVQAVSGGSLYGVGFNLMAGMASGIRSGAVVAAVAARAAVNQAISSAKAAAEIHSPSRKTEREIGRPFIQGVAVGIDKDAAGVRSSMVNALDVSGVSGEAPNITGQGRSKVALHIHNPVVRDLMQEAYDAASMAGVLA